jgi:hypothetical protein
MKIWGRLLGGCVIPNKRSPIKKMQPAVRESPDPKEYNQQWLENWATIS